MNDAVVKMARQLRLGGMLETLEVRLQEAMGNNLSHDEFLELILQDVAGDNYIPTSTTTTLRHELRPERMLIRAKEGLVDACNGPAGKEVADGIPEERRSRNGSLEGGDAPRDSREVYSRRAVAFAAACRSGLADAPEPI
jgi:hypothetical protein